MDYRLKREADCAAEARILLSAAARGVNQLESAAEQASGRLAALTGILSQLKELPGSHEPEADAAAASSAAAVCRHARAPLRSLDALGKRPAVVTVVVRQVAAPSAN